MEEKKGKWPFVGLRKELSMAMAMAKKSILPQNRFCFSVSKSKAPLVHLGLKRFGGYARNADVAC